MAIKLAPVDEPATELRVASAPTTPGDVFANLERRRLRQTFDKLKTRKPLTTVGIRKPKAARVVPGASDVPPGVAAVPGGGRRS